MMEGVKYRNHTSIVFYLRIFSVLVAHLKCVFPASPQDGGFDIRLQDGTVPWEGRVEIYINGDWGTVCASDSWDVNRASYFCRLLHFDSAVSVIRDPTIFGPGSGPVVIDNIECKDYKKTSFLNCEKVFFPRDCATPAAAVRCLEHPYDDLADSIRFVGGDSPYEGRVELNINGIWASICAHDWDTPNGNTACKQMGFGPAINTKSVSYGNGDGPVFIGNVRCKGTETTLLECEHVEIMMGDCEGNGRDDLGVSCSNPSDLYPLRLRGFRGSTSRQGIVEIGVNNRWGSICTSTWTEYNSRVVCRGLGLGPPEGRPELPSPEEEGDDYPYVYSPPVLERVNCDGSEPHLAFCSHTPWKNSTTGPGCLAWQIVTITCGDPVTKDYSIRLHNATSAYDGHIEIFYENQWGAVCSNAWGTEDAVVACRQLGLGTPGRVYNTTYNEEAITSVVDNLQCTGEERSIKECLNIGFGRRSCNVMEIASITCTKPQKLSEGLLPVRLVDGKINEREGRVEIYYNSTWRSVCDTNWGTEEGDVVCRQLGYGRAILTPTGSFFTSEPIVSDTSEIEERVVRMWLDNIECVGSEVMLAACSHSQWGMASCSSDQEAGVRCADSGSISTTFGVATLATAFLFGIFSTI